MPRYWTGFQDPRKQVPQDGSYITTAKEEKWKGRKCLKPVVAVDWLVIIPSSCPLSSVFIHWSAESFIWDALIGLTVHRSLDGTVQCGSFLTVPCPSILQDHTKGLILSLGRWCAGQFSHRTILATLEQCGESVWGFREDVEKGQMRVCFRDYRKFKFSVQLTLWAKFRARAGFGTVSSVGVSPSSSSTNNSVPSSHCLELSSLSCNNSFVE